jgi:phosphatidylglycerophosphatase A
MRVSCCGGACRIKNRLVSFIATGGYIGYVPLAPGTWGSVLGVGVFLLLASLPLPVYGVLLISFIIFGTWGAGEAERLLGKKDPAPIVIDEIAGMLVTYFALPVAVWPVLLGFGFFRLFDVCKPLPQLEQLPGGWGIMLDDLCAGLVTQCLVRLVLRIAGVA